MADYERAVELRPEDPNLQYDLARLYALEHRTEPAIARLTEAERSRSGYAWLARQDEDFRWLGENDHLFALEFARLPDETGANNPEQEVLDNYLREAMKGTDTQSIDLIDEVATYKMRLRLIQVAAEQITIGASISRKPDEELQVRARLIDDTGAAYPGTDYGMNMPLGIDAAATTLQFKLAAPLPNTLRLGLEVELGTRPASAGYPHDKLPGVFRFDLSGLVAAPPAT